MAREAAQPDYDAALNRYLQRIQPLLGRLARLRLQLSSLEPRGESEAFFFTPAQRQRRQQAAAAIRKDIEEVEQQELPVLARLLTPERPRTPGPDLQALRRLRQQRDAQVAAAISRLRGRLQELEAEIHAEPRPAAPRQPPPAPPTDDGALQSLQLRAATLGSDGPPREEVRSAPGDGAAQSGARARLRRHVDREVQALVVSLARQRAPAVTPVFHQERPALREATASFIPRLRQRLAVATGTRAASVR